MGIWKSHRIEIKRSNFSERVSRQLLENRSRIFPTMRGTNSFQREFFLVQRVQGREGKRRLETLMQGHVELCCGSIELHREIKNWLRSSQDIVSKLGCETGRPEI